MSYKNDCSPIWKNRGAKIGLIETVYPKSVEVEGCRQIAQVEKNKLLSGLSIPENRVT